MSSATTSRSRGPRWRAAWHIPRTPPHRERNSLRNNRQIVFVGPRFKQLLGPLFFDSRILTGGSSVVRSSRSVLATRQFETPLPTRASTRWLELEIIEIRSFGSPGGHPCLFSPPGFWFSGLCGLPPCISDSPGFSDSHGQFCMSDDGSLFGMTHIFGSSSLYLRGLYLREPSPRGPYVRGRMPSRRLMSSRSMSSRSMFPRSAPPKNMSVRNAVWKVSVRSVAPAEFPCPEASSSKSHFWSACSFEKVPSRASSSTGFSTLFRLPVARSGSGRGLGRLVGF